MSSSEPGDQAINNMARPGDVANLVMQRDLLLQQRDSLLYAAQKLGKATYQGRLYSASQAYKELMQVVASIEKTGSVK